MVISVQSTDMQYVCVMVKKLYMRNGKLVRDDLDANNG